MAVGTIFPDTTIALETNIVEQLANLGPNIEAINLPEDEVEFQRFFNKRGIVVNYASSDYGSVQSVGHVSQQEVLQVDLLLIAKRRKGEGGLFELKNMVIKRLLGFQPGDGTLYGTFDRMYAISFKGKETRDGVFVYMLTMCTRKLIVQTDEVDPVETTQTINQITYQ